MHFHEHRLNYTRKKLLKRSDTLKIPPPKPPDHGTYRYKVVYSHTINSCELTPYTRTLKRNIVALQKDIQYNFKFLDRECFDALRRENSNFDDVLVVKKGLVTDTTIANCAFFDGTKWLTPSTPLLRGTCRERLLRAKAIFPEKIYVKDLHTYSLVAFLNGLTGFYIAGETKRIIHVK